MATIAIPTPAYAPGTQTIALPAQNLIERAKNGDQQAFLGLFQAHSKRIYSMSLRLAGTLSAAEDLTRDIFVDAFHNLNAIGDEQEFSTWLYQRAARIQITTA
jgi:RNA polymerase sigma-70 factor (ECF subfamily)